MSKSPHQEWGAAGGRTTASRRTAKQRKEASSHAHLASVVAQIVAKAPALTDEQRSKLKAVLAPAARAPEPAECVTAPASPALPRVPTGSGCGGGDAA